jgi:GntR family transcriptional regulator, rspAB operon transcriptional repressor
MPAAEQPVRSIYDQIRRDIVTLEARPGERLSENELAARFGTSRAPVREALIRLAEDGLIIVRPQRGSYVSRISLAAMEQARFVREALEVAILRRAAEAGLSAAARASCEAAIAAQEAARDDALRFTEQDDRFHRGFAEGAELTGVWAIIEREKVQFDRVRFLSLPAVTPTAVLIRQHRAMLDAVLRRRPDQAEAAIRKHLQEVLAITQSLAARYPELIDER